MIYEMDQTCRQTKSHLQHLPDNAKIDLEIFENGEEEEKEEANCLMAAHHSMWIEVTIM